MNKPLDPGKDLMSVMRFRLFSWVLSISFPWPFSCGSGRFPRLRFERQYRYTQDAHFHVCEPGQELFHPPPILKPGQRFAFPSLADANGLGSTARGSNSLIKAYVPCSENFKYGITNFYSPINWALETNCGAFSPRQTNFSDYNNRYWIFSTYSYDPAGTFVLGFCHAENYAPVSSAYGATVSAAGIQGFPFFFSNPLDYSNYGHYWGASFNLIYSFEWQPRI